MDAFGPQRQTHLFSAVRNKELQREVEDALATFGVHVVDRKRYADQLMREEMKEELVATVYAPERFMGLIERYGMEALQSF